MDLPTPHGNVCPKGEASRADAPRATIAEPHIPTPEKTSVESAALTANFRILCHHIYEYRKGLRSLVLHTMKSCECEAAEALLQRQQIDYIIQPISPCRFNVFFGDPRCVKIVELFDITQLTHLSDEQDFILGIMLGYSRTAQYERYLHRKASPTTPNE